MILVTGATGTVGSEVVRILRDKGVAFCAAVHRRPLDVEGIESRHIDFDRPETLQPALDGIRSVFLASHETLHETAMAEAVRRAEVDYVVKLSAWRADEEQFMFGRLHRAVERAIEESGVAWTFLRPNFFMHNFVTVMGEAIRSDAAIYDSIGEARISHIDARDIAEVAAQVLTETGHEGMAYDLSGPEALTHDEIAATLSRTLGRTIRHVRITDDDPRHPWVAVASSEDEAAAGVDVCRYARTGATSTVTTTVRDITGRKPNTFAAFCRDYATAFAPALAEASRAGRR